MLIDTHTHIYTEEFDADRPDVVARAREAGVGIMLLPNINAASVRPLLDTCRTWPGICYPLIGLHPEDVREDYAEVLGQMEKSLPLNGLYTPFGSPVIGGQKPFREGVGVGFPFVGIGETGLDFYWDVTYKKEQLKAFERQLGWAAEYHLPVVIHQRAAFDELYAIMQSFPTSSPSREGVGEGLPLTGIFHCFGGTAEQAEKLLSFPGFMLGIGGTVTYKKSTLPDVLRSVVPLERIVLETDAPYLAPVPHRGKRNEPSFLVAVAEKLAEIYACSPADIAARTTANARSLFPSILMPT